MSVGKGLFVTTSQRVPAWDPRLDLAWLVALARRLARPGDDADDLAQETRASHDEAPDVSDSFVFRYTVGAPPQPTAEFLAARPDLLAQHPEFAALAKLQPGQAPAPEDASAFARWLEEDLDAQAAFAKWVTEQGIDLANVNVEDDPPPTR